MIAKTISPENPEQVSCEASGMAERLREQILHKDISFCFETDFSHKSKIDFVAETKAIGYYVFLVYRHIVTAIDTQASAWHTLTHEKRTLIFK
jgi:predicted ABC-type ATPase